MPVYIDSMNLNYRGMVMCHMLADTHHELVAMAKVIGMRPAWIQNPGTVREHFDVTDGRFVRDPATGKLIIDPTKSRKRVALKNGAIEVNRRGIYEVMMRMKDDFEAYMRPPVKGHEGQLDMFASR